MSEELYAPIPDVDAYLTRIGIAEAKEPTVSFLDEIIDAHQRFVPFDNLDTCEKGLTPSLAIDDLYDKIVVRKRGGYCFELNALFGALLKALGFDVRPCMARVLLRPIPHPLISHRANIVTIDDKQYLADVGFGGPQPRFAPLLEDGSCRTEQGQTFTMRRIAHSWWEMYYRSPSGEDKPSLRVCMLNVGEEDFIPLSFYQSNFPESVFKLNRMVYLNTENGALNLRNDTYTVITGEEKTSREINADELDQLLEESFGIVDWR